MILLHKNNHFKSPDIVPTSCISVFFLPCKVYSGNGKSGGNSMPHPFFYPYRFSIHLIAWQFNPGTVPGTAYRKLEISTVGLSRLWVRLKTTGNLYFTTALKEGGLHTYATLRLSKGDSLAEVSKEMGHGSPDITYRTYYKWMPKLSVSDIDELDKRMLKNATIRNLSATG